MHAPHSDPHIAKLERRLDEGDTWEQKKKTLPRDPGTVQIGRIDPGGATKHKHTPIPVSITMPITKEQGTIVNRFGTKVRQLKSGHYATMAGVRIVDSKQARDFHAGDSGMIVQK